MKTKGYIEEVRSEDLLIFDPNEDVFMLKKYPIDVLKALLMSYEDDEEYEMCIEIRDEIGQRE